MRKIRLKIAIIIVLALVLTCLSGCSGNAKATDAIDSVLVAIQDQDEQEIKNYLSAVRFDSEEYSVSEKAFAAVYFSDFSYEIIGSEKNKSGTVTVDVKITTKSMKDMLSALEEARNIALESGSFTAGSPSADAELIDIFESRNWDTHENIFNIEMEKNESGDWQPADKALLGAMLLDGYDPRQV